MKVENFRVKNQFRIYGENKEILQSYNSKVVEIENINGNYKITLGRDWDYSTTTSKYVYEFLEEFTPYNIINLYGVKNKRKHINDLIKDGAIGYDVTMY